MIGIFFLTRTKQCRLKLRLLNRGGSTAKNVSLEIECAHPDVAIDNPEIEIGELIAR